MVACTAYVGSTKVSHKGERPTKTITRTGKPTTLHKTVSAETETVTKAHTSTVTSYSIYTTEHFTTTVNTTKTHTASVSRTRTVTNTPTPLGYYYAACGAENLLNYTVLLNSSSTHVAIQGFEDTGDHASPQVTRATTAYDCCVACIQNTKCAGNYWTGGFCFLQIQTSCPKLGDRNFGNFTYDPAATQEPGSRFVVSNGNCGEWGYGGPDDFA